MREPYADDIYIAGGELSIDAPIGGDCVIAGGQISLNDSIAEDLIVGGGEINIRGIVGDDVRAAGGELEIESDIMDDLIVFGGQVKIKESCTIHGNLVSFGGELRVEGTVLGEVKASGGEIEINGEIRGPATLSSGSLEIGEQAAFFSDVNYWTEDGEVDFGGSMESGEARFDTSLAWEGNDYFDGEVFLGLGLFFLFVYFLGGFLIVLLLEWAFGKWFSKAANEVMVRWANTLGIGVIYLIGLPVIVIFCFMIVIGIPVGLFGLVMYIFSIVFGNFVGALVMAHAWKDNKKKTWNTFLTALIALLISIGLHILTSIPILGAVISFAVLCFTYGAIILAIKNKNKGYTGPSEPVSVGFQS